MRHSFAWLGAAALVVVLGAQTNVRAQGLKPYVIFDLDTSGSMNTATGAGTTSCGTPDTRLNHANCAIEKIANSYGDIVFALARFRMVSTGTYSTTCSGDCNLLGADDTPSLNCQDAGNDDDHFELLTPLLDGNNDDAAVWTDSTCNTCGTTLANNPEIFEPDGNTPIAGSLLGAYRYWRGLQATNGVSIWPAAAPGGDPIRNDPLHLKYVVGNGNNAGDVQCRPYIVIALTDGGETCGGNPPAAAATMLDTVVSGLHYRIETKPIGFGIAAGDAAIEAIAHSGGNPGDGNGGANEGFYAQNEQDISLAIATILAGTIRSETCNGLDDDCDTAVDEDFPSLGTACDDGLLGVCLGTGTYVCRADGTGTQCNITNPGQSPGTEVCNGLDDNCNGQIDEGLMCGGCGDAETCNNIDDDCDLLTDENLTRPCGTDLGVCSAGIETCVSGIWQGCTGTGGGTEHCNGLDDDCDGTVDGFSRPCTNLPPPGNPNIGPCHPGIQTCPVNSPPPHNFGACLGEVVPGTEVCNDIDDDCDGTIDEDTGGADCSSTCGVGTIVCCHDGDPDCDPGPTHLECNSTIVTGPEIICNGLDDDCDMLIDEDYVGGPCDGGGTICNGMLNCINGMEVCLGDTVSPEQCDCHDNDCDGATDEEPPNLCPAGATCTSCQCAFPCGDGEFPCPQGRKCEAGFCVIDPCYMVTCNPDVNGDATSCVDGTCVRTCDNLPCNPPDTVCYGPSGTCAPDDCRTFPDRCTGDEVCKPPATGNLWSCVSDPCAGVNCPSDQYCLAGNCLMSCGDLDCPTGTRCHLGMCEPDACGGPCPLGHICDDATGTCVLNPCNGRTCPDGFVCDPAVDDCVIDPCIGVTCPGNDICQLGTCHDPSEFEPDAAGPEEHVTTGGGGGCSAGGGGVGGAGLLVALVALAARRRRGGRS